MLIYAEQDMFDNIHPMLRCQDDASPRKNDRISSHVACMSASSLHTIELHEVYELRNYLCILSARRTGIACLIIPSLPNTPSHRDTRKACAYIIIIIINVYTFLILYYYML